MLAGVFFSIIINFSKKSRIIRNISNTFKLVFFNFITYFCKNLLDFLNKKK